MNFGKGVSIELLLILSINSIAIGQPSAFKLNNKLWDNSVVPFKFDANFVGEQHKEHVKTIMAEIQYLSCVKFVPHTKETGKYFIHIYGRNLAGSLGCSAKIGQRRDSAMYLLVPSCIKSRTISLILKLAIGFFPEEILSEFNTGANRFLSEYNDVLNLDGSSDFEETSREHEYRLLLMQRQYIPPYGNREQPRTNASVTKILSKEDVQRLNELYKCDEKLGIKTGWFTRIRQSHSKNTSKDEGIQCKDYHPYCHVYKDKRYCILYEEISKKYCAKTCAKD